MNSKQKYKDMKIISKFTDFYEYDAYRYGEPDKSLVWVRKTEEYDYDKPFLNKKFHDNIFSKYFATSINRKYDYSFRPSITFHQELVGIYPFVYYIPYINIHNGNYYNGFNDYIVGDEMMFSLMEKGYLSELLESKGIDVKRFDIDSTVERILKWDTKPHFYNKSRNIFDLANLVVEDKELFNKLKTPVFWIGESRRYYTNTVAIETNTNLLESFILKAYPEVTQRDIYNDIENFLWEMKSEKMSEPDNKTKILAHGFDLKTSFRKM